MDITALTCSVVPGRRRSISLQSTTPSFSAHCRNAAGSDTLFFGDSITPSVMSHVTVCSAGFMVKRRDCPRSRALVKEENNWRSGYQPAVELSATIFRVAARVNVAHRVVCPCLCPSELCEAFLKIMNDVSVKTPLAGTHTTLHLPRLLLHLLANDITDSRVCVCVWAHLFACSLDRFHIILHGHGKDIRGLL